MLDLSRFETALLPLHPERWARHHLASFRSAYFQAFDPADVARHLEQIRSLAEDRPVVVWVRAERPGTWQVELVGYDTFQFLSTACSLLTIHGFSIAAGQAFTSTPEPSTAQAPTRRPKVPGRAGPCTAQVAIDRRPMIVDRFLVKRIEGLDPEFDWDPFQAELTELVRLLRADRLEEVHRRLLDRFVAAIAREPVDESSATSFELTIDPGETAFATVIRTRARDRPGFVSLTASSLALSGIKIVQADVRTEGSQVDDTFWVTDRNGRPIDDPSRLRELRLALTLIEHYSAYLPHATNPASALVHFSAFAADTMARPNWSTEYAALDRAEVLDALVRVLGESDFLWEDFLHAQPENLLPMIDDPAQWKERRAQDDLRADCALALESAQTLEERGHALRRFRDREFFRTGVRAILGRCGGPEAFAAELSDQVDVLLRGADRLVRDELGPILPRRTDGSVVPSTLLTMGKCGGRELGFGSDLELMLVYDDTQIDDPGAATAAITTFDRYVALLRQALVARRGGSFELDFRLRPYGKSGPPATARSAFADYYRAGGPAWGYERQALIKLRMVAGDVELGQAIERLRDDFVYGAEPFDTEACRRLRRMQVSQLVRPGVLNAKYSPGALVDVEYFVQAQQILHGRRDPSVRTAGTLPAIDALIRSAPDLAEPLQTLRRAYRFYRALIDALRVVHGNSKDLTIPARNSEEFSRLARRLRCDNPAALSTELDDTLSAVRGVWDLAEDLLVANSA